MDVFFYVYYDVGLLIGTCTFLILLSKSFFEIELLNRLGAPETRQKKVYLYRSTSHENKSMGNLGCGQKKRSRSTPKKGVPLPQHES